MGTGSIIVLSIPIQALFDFIFVNEMRWVLEQAGDMVWDHDIGENELV